MILVSSYLPYDAAIYARDLDAVLISYGSTAMNALPQDGETVCPNLPAAICGAFGEYAFTGKLAVDIPDLLNGGILFAREVS